jgi:inner membrane protein
MLKSPLFWKMTTLFGAVLLLLIPIMLIRQVIVERADYRSDVEDAIRQSTSGPQKLVGPLIAIPVTELYTVQEDDKTVERKRSFIHFWLPESLMVDGNQNVEERKIGIYTGQVWHSDLTLKADFDVSRLSELDAPNITLGKPFIVISVGDARGIGVVKAPEVNGTALTIEPGTGLEQGGQGVHIPLPEGDLRKQNLKLNVALHDSASYYDAETLNYQKGLVGRYLPSRVMTARDPPSGSSTFLISSLKLIALIMPSPNFSWTNALSVVP